MSQFIYGIRKTLLCILCYFPVSTPNIIYVHLGPSIPTYIFTSINQAHLFNPTTPIYLIANQQALHLCPEESLKNSIPILAESLKTSSFHALFNKKTVLDNKQRDGLWRKSTERFFYIHELMLQNSLESAIHLESDNMLYVSIHELQHGLSSYNGIGAVFDHDNRCIPSLVYIAHTDAIEHLVKFIAEKAHLGKNDMQILALYRNSYSEKYIDNLPLIIPDFTNDHALINTQKQSTKYPNRYINNFASFNSIFDAAALGQYLGGIDPRNGISKPGFINETCLFNPSYFSYEWHTDTKGRKIPFICYQGKSYRINNLHIHSKNLESFKS